MLSEVSETTHSMRDKVERMHLQLEKRNSKTEDSDIGIARLSVVFFLILFIFGGGQMFYLTHFLKKKKLV